MYKGALTVCLALLLAACSSMYQEPKPVNCATAERDIKKLESDRILGGVDETMTEALIDEIKQTCGL